MAMPQKALTCLGTGLPYPCFVKDSYYPHLHTACPDALRPRRAPYQNSLILLLKSTYKVVNETGRNRFRFVLFPGTA